jgi:hypothetical protein
VAGPQDGIAGTADATIRLDATTRWGGRGLWHPEDSPCVETGLPCSRSRSGVPLDKERERSTERGVGLEPQRLSRYQAEAGKACAQFLEHNARLEASQRCTQAIVRSEPEGEVLLGILPVDVKVFGALKDRGIAGR